jgi:hypothetical protein
VLHLVGTDLYYLKLSYPVLRIFEWLAVKTSKGSIELLVG